jgi:cbb3-type cytochrome oxidase maturation protein
MAIALLLIPLALILTVVAVWAFFWAVDSGQFDNLEAEGQRILDEDPVPAPAEPPKRPASF